MFIKAQTEKYLLGWVVCVKCNEELDSGLENLISGVYHGDEVEGAVHYLSGAQMTPLVPHMPFCGRKLLCSPVLDKTMLLLCIF